MRRENVRLEILDKLIHYSLSILLGLPIFIFAAYFLFGELGLFGNNSSMDGLIVIIPSLILGPMALLVYFIQWDKLKFKFIPTPEIPKDLGI